MPLNALAQQYGIDTPTQTGGTADTPSWISDLANSSWFAPIKYMGETLGKPQQALYGLVHGFQTGDFGGVANILPFSDFLGITNDNKPWSLTSHRLSGQQLLEDAGVLDKSQGNSWGNWGAGLATDILTDPLNFFGGFGALTKTGKAIEMGQQAGKLAPTLGGRVAAGQAGLIGVRSTPWYFDLIPGMGKGETTALLGQGTIGEPIAKGLTSGYDLATLNVPGVAKARGLFGVGSANVTQHPQAVVGMAEEAARNADVLGKVQTQAVQGVGRPQAEFMNEAAKFGIDNPTSADMLATAARSLAETGTPRISQSGFTGPLPQELEDLIKQYATPAAAAQQGYQDVVKGIADSPGLKLGEFDDIWGTPFYTREKIGTRGSTGHLQGREPYIKLFPGGGDQFAEHAANPEIAGFARQKELGMPIDRAAIEQQLGKNTQYFSDMIGDAARQRVAKLTATSQEIPDELLKLASDPTYLGKQSRGLAEYMSRINPADVANGSFWNPDLLSVTMNYGNQVVNKALRAEGALNTVSRFSKPSADLERAVTDAAQVMTIPKALETMGLDVGKASANLANRMGVPVEELANRSVTTDLANALKQEIVGYRPGPKGLLDKIGSAFRYAVTQPWPANLVRNWTTEEINQLISGGSVKNSLTAQQFLTGNLPEFSHSEGVLETSDQLGKTSLKISAPLGQEASLPKQLEELASKAGMPFDPANVTINKVPNPQIAKMQAAFEAGMAHDPNFLRQQSQLVGNGVDRMVQAINVAPTQGGEGMLSSLKNAMSPMWSEEARTGAGIKPFSEMASESSPAVQKLAGLGDTVLGPARGYLNTMERAHNFQNVSTRLQGIANFMDEGYTPAAAVAKTRTIQRDYGNLTPFEQNVMRNVVPFYNFAKQNLISQATIANTQPGRFGAMLHAINSGRSDDSFVPSWASQGTAIPLPGAPEGQQRFLGSLGLPIEDESIGALAALSGGNVREAIRRLASQSNPLAKTAYELATGTQIFSGRKLDELRASPTLSGLFGDNAFSRLLSEAAQGTPASRIISSTDRVLDAERKGPIATAANLLTGLRAVDVDMGQAADLAAKQKLQDLLAASQYYKVRQDIGVAPQWKGQEDQIPPQLQALMSQYRMLQQVGRDVAKRKALANP